MLEASIAHLYYQQTKYAGELLAALHRSTNISPTPLPQSPPAVVIFHTVNLLAVIAKWGDRVYYYLPRNTGHLGQRLNLAAIYLNLGGSGTGVFFDDRVNKIWGIPPEEVVLYITTLGSSVLLRLRQGKIL